MFASTNRLGISETSGEKTVILKAPYSSIQPPWLALLLIPVT